MNNGETLLKIVCLRDEKYVEENPLPSAGKKNRLSTIDSVQNISSLTRNGMHSQAGIILISSYARDI